MRQIFTAHELLARDRRLARENAELRCFAWRPRLELDKAGVGKPFTAGSESAAPGAPVHVRGDQLRLHPVHENLDSRCRARRFTGGPARLVDDKFREWTHPREALPHDVVGIDRLLLDVLLYWLTDTPLRVRMSAPPSNQFGSAGLHSQAPKFAVRRDLRCAETMITLTR